MLVRTKSCHVKDDQYFQMLSASVKIMKTENPGVIQKVFHSHKDKLIKKLLGSWQLIIYQV